MTLWAYHHNWRGSYKITLSCKTDIIVAEDGSEQRRALRQTPRKSIETNALLTQDQVPAVERLFAASLNTGNTMAERTRKLVIGALTISQTTVSCAPPFWLVNGMAVVLIDGSRFATATVSSVGSTSITFSAAPGVWGASTKLCPALTGRIVDPTIDFETKSTAVVTVRFDVFPGTESLEPDADPDQTLNGREVLPLKPNWIRAPRVTYSWPSDTLDFGHGRIAIDVTQQFASRTWSASYLRTSLLDIEKLIAFFRRMKGRRGEFWLPWPSAPVYPVSNLTTATSTITVVGQSGLNGAAPVYHGVEIEKLDGSRFRASIVGAAASGNNTTLTLDSSFTPEGGLPKPAITWLYVARLSSDDLVVEYLTDRIAQTQLSFTTLQNLEVDPLTGIIRATTDGDDRMTADGADRVVIA